MKNLKPIDSKATIGKIDYFKIHPAIGFARLGGGIEGASHDLETDSYFEFFAQEKLRKEDKAKNRTKDELKARYSYKKQGGLDTGKHFMKRQAVQYRLVGYDGQGKPLGYIENHKLGVKVTWKAQIANRKMYNWDASKPENKIVGPKTPVATQNAPVALNGNLWWNNEEVTLGHLTGEGLFIPPFNRIYVKDGVEIQPYKANKSRDCMDSTSDGWISASLEVDGAGIPDEKIVPGWVVVGPPDHSPDITPVDLEGIKFNHGLQRVIAGQTGDGIAGSPKISGAGNLPMDLHILNTANGEFNPGMEIVLAIGSKSGRSRAEIADAKNVFYQPGGSPYVKRNEIRVRQKNGNTGTEPGQLTSGLCSTWHGDIEACTDYWTAEYPKSVYVPKEDDSFDLVRGKYDENFDNRGGAMEEKNFEFTRRYMDMMGVGRLLEGQTPKDKPSETERTATDTTDVPS